MSQNRTKHDLFLKLIVVISLVVLTACDRQTLSDKDAASPPEPVLQELTYHSLPDNINWLTNDRDPVFSCPKAIKGGMVRSALPSFPMTFRVVGPDSNGGFRSAILDNQLSLINIHPNTRNIIPELATHWAFDGDKKTMYFKLDPDARWSDGRPVTARDYIYTLTFMRSEHIIAPWYNDYYTREIEAVIAYDDYTIGVKSTKAVPDLYLKLGIGPIPEHYFGVLDSEFITRYNWAVVPNTGAYRISEFKKGRFIRFKRKQDWWAADKKYFKNRFNVDTVQFTVIRDLNLQWEYFKKGRLDTFDITLPKYWHVKSKTPVIENGYVDRIWFFNDQEHPSRGMWLNQDKEIFKDERLRRAFAHAMNVDRVINKVLRGDYFRLPQAFYGYGKYTDYTITPREYDISRVESLMIEAGWQRGNDGVWKKGNMRFSVLVTYYSEEHMPRLVVLKEEALKAGIELRLEKLDPSAMFKKTLEKQHDVAWMGWSTNMRPSYWQGWHSDNAHKPQTNNITNTDDPELDALIDRYRDSLDEDERIRLSLRIQNKIHSISAYVPTFMIPYVRIAYWRWMKLPDFHGTRASDSLFDPFSSTTGGLFWIDPDTRRQTLDAMDRGETFPPVLIMDKRYKYKADES
ncbi:MAG: extracellular solute-binding protein [Desulfobacterales bacterium]|nr:extracellular solute-binding protein [Desulfobacterales bacterium]